MRAKKTPKMLKKTQKLGKIKPKTKRGIIDVDY